MGRIGRIVDLRWAAIRAALLVAALAGVTFTTPVRAEEPKRVLVFGDSNSWGWTPEPNGFPTVRLKVGERWPDVMAKRLGAGVAVTVDALSGRTVDVSYPGPLGTVPGGQLNGLSTLPAAIAREMPLDLVVIMLGTNDLRPDLNRTPEQIAAGLRGLAETVRGSAGGVLTSYPAPPVLVVVPPYVEDTSRTPISSVMDGSQAKSRALMAAVTATFTGTDTPIVDASRFITVHGVDGVHLTRSDHKALGEALAGEVSRVLAEAPAARR